jgi:2-polyprenyl-6-methoxyphenol hydroxylase-like FAD-dependent oxidoreductase
VVQQRVALVGDAAHTVHPLAGQGVNLGFQDAAVLAEILNGASDPGAWMLLTRYQRRRREAVITMQWACDGLFNLFHQQSLPGLARLRNTGLSLVNHFGPLKRRFARHAVGC